MRKHAVLHPRLASSLQQKIPKVRGADNQHYYKVDFQVHANYYSAHCDYSLWVEGENQGTVEVHYSWSLFAPFISPSCPTSCWHWFCFWLVLFDGSDLASRYFVSMVKFVQAIFFFFFELVWRIRKLSMQTLNTTALPHMLPWNSSSSSPRITFDHAISTLASNVRFKCYF